jgi:anti-sigma regulatory factor (Ser/Thr protein kinase)
MRVVGTVALDPGRVPAATVATLAADVATAVWSCIRTVVRGVAAMLRTGRPALVALLTATRPRARLVAASFARAASSARVASLVSADVAPRLLIPAQVGGSVQGRAAGAPARRYELALPADRTAPRRARALLHEAATDWGVADELYHDAAMVVTELVANAVDHARTASTLTLGFDDSGLSIAVRDGNTGLVPRPRPVDPTAPRGRGLQMVEALAVSWGVTVQPDGKTVWAVLAGA